MQDLDERLASLEQQLDEKHKAELECLHAQLEQSIPEKAKASPTLLNLRQIQQNLARMKKYADAHETQQRALELEAKEQEVWSEKRANKIAAQESALILKQKKEKEGLESRMQKTCEELKQQKAVVIKTLRLKYDNIKKQMGNTRKMQAVKDKRMGQTSVAMHAATRGSKEFSRTASRSLSKSGTFTRAKWVADTLKSHWK